jgi:hypothetical protein
MEVRSEGGGLRLRLVVVPTALEPTKVSVRDGFGVPARWPRALRVGTARVPEAPRHTPPVEALPRR